MKDVKKRKKGKKILFIVLAIFVLFIVLCAVSGNSGQKFSWTEDIVLNQMLPSPPSEKGEIVENSEDSLSLDVYSVESNEYANYVNDCIKKGYNTEQEKEESSFNSYNDKGYKLELNYDTDNKKMNLNLEAPMKLGNITWSSLDIAKLLPVPKFINGKTETENEEEYSLYLGGISKTSYENYINECVKSGFNLKQDKSDDLFTSKNKDDYSLEVRYVGNKVIYVSVQEPKYKDKIEVDYKSELFDENYDINVYVDGDLLGSIANSNKETYDYTFRRGTHEFKFENAENSKISKSVKLKITKQQKLQFQITATTDAINVDVLNGEVVVEVKSIKLDSTYDIEFSDLFDYETIDFEVETTSNEDIDDYTKLLDFVSENEKVAKVEYANDSFSNQIKITPIANGETVIYIKSKSNDTVSDKIKVTVKEETTQDEEYYEETSNSGRTVYVTPYGKKYHFSKSCAGKNASEIDEESAKSMYDPCQKCAY